MFWDATLAEGSDLDVPDFFEVPQPWRHAKNLGLTSEEVKKKNLVYILCVW